MMTRIEYKAFPAVAGDNLEILLNKYGKEGWRLHTCEPYAVDAWRIFYLVVMDKMEIEDDEVIYPNKLKGIPMKG